MLILFYILCSVVGILFGLVLAKVKEPNCKHKWSLIKSGNVVNDYNKVYGIYKFYECEDCKKMKKQQLNLD